MAVCFTKVLKEHYRLVTLPCYRGILAHVYHDTTQFIIINKVK